MRNNFKGIAMRIKLIAQNKKAFRDYFIEETLQTGIALAGTEVKSLRLGKCSLKESYVKIKNGEAFLINAHISPYEQGNIFNKDPLRERKLLLHKKQIAKLQIASVIDGYTLVPLKIYFSGSLVKVDIAIAKGKKLYDKREALAKKDAAREMERSARKFSV
jgi:SsrA-binding protein